MCWLSWLTSVVNSLTADDLNSATAKVLYGLKTNEDTGATRNPNSNSWEATPDEAFLQLLRAGMDVETRDEFGMTPLMSFARGGMLRKVKFMIWEEGANVGTQDKVGFSALHGAADMGHLEVVKWLIKEAGADVYAID
jgi:ankyrin repeat protein